MADSAHYTVRVELHDSDDYEELHNYMEKEGFVRYVVLKSGEKLQVADGGVQHLQRQR